MGGCCARTPDSEIRRPQLHYRQNPNNQPNPIINNPPLKQILDSKLNELGPQKPKNSDQLPSTQHTAGQQSVLPSTLVNHKKAQVIVESPSFVNSQIVQMLQHQDPRSDFFKGIPRFQNIPSTFTLGSRLSIKTSSEIKSNMSNGTKKPQLPPIKEMNNEPNE